jgi:sugar lactone lactonase YvrE
MHIATKQGIAGIHRPARAAAGTMALLSLSFLIAGCSLSSTAPLAVEQPSSAAISGNVHGGQFPIYNATMKLYAAGYTGYGSATTALATTTTDAGGNFSFSGLPYTCPSPSTQMYITAVGGNTQGTGVTTTNNAAAALIVAIGPCSTIAGLNNININEVTTIATVFALAQYMNPGTTAGTESIGTAATPQAALGLANAVASIQNLASISTGGPVTPPTYTGSNATVSGVSVTATAESAKLVTLANIIAACVNQTSASTSVCQNLLAAATPPPNPSVTSQPSATFSTATDTIQAAYYMAVNPTDAGTAATCSPAASSNMACLFNLPPTSPPFQPGLVSMPTDWTIGVTYTSTGTCTGGGSFIAAPFHAAVDASGNLWYVNGVASTSNLAEMSPTGQPLFCAGAQSYGRGVSIDPTGNVWGSFENTGSSNILEYNAGTASLVSWPSAGSVAPYSIVSDKSGNIFYSITSTGTINEFAAPGATSTAVASTQIGLADSGSNFDYLAADQVGRIWTPDSGASILADYYPPTGDSAAITKIAIGSNVLTVAVASNPFTVGEQVTFSNVGINSYLNGQTVTITSITSTTFKASFTHANVTSATDSGSAAIVTSNGYDTSLIAGSGHGYSTAVDSNGYVYTVSTCCSGAQLVKFTPNSYGDNATYSASAQFLGGINGTRGIAHDGAANVWIGAEYPMSPGVYGVSEIATSGSGTSATFTALSPTGSTPSPCSTTTGACATGGGFQKSSLLVPTDIEVDPSGNVWVLNTETITAPDSGTSITEIVGAAVPTATPLSVAAQNGALATKP